VVLESVKPAMYVALAWFDRKFKNHRLPTRVVGTHFTQTQDNYEHYVIDYLVWQENLPKLL